MGGTSGDLDAAGSPVEVTTSIAGTGLTVTVHVVIRADGPRAPASPAKRGPGELGDERPSSGGRRPAAAEAETETQPEIALGAGRTLPNLLFVTNETLLADQIGTAETEFVKSLVHDAGQRLLVVRGGEPEELAAIVTGQVTPETAGVVLIGGYGVIPSFQIDTLPPEAASAGVRRRLDPDEFIVWSDDRYADLDGDGLPELPVSRVPDAHSHLMTIQGLCTGHVTQPPGAGVRNMARPFADAVAGVPSGFPMAVSHPTESTTLASSFLTESFTYLMLHGTDSDGTRFWGEDDSGRLVETIMLADLPDTLRGTFFSGCCWGALIVSQMARRAKPGVPLADRVEAQSIALSVLGRGAEAFVGSTGAHYSPRGAVPDRASGPWHVAFFEAILGGDAAAAATFKAKQAYLGHIGTITDANDLAVATKVLNQFTCLGLGW